MTTAHRPTWNSVKGGSEQGGNKLVQPSRQYSALDMPSNLKLKERRDGQGSTNEQQLLDFKQELLQKEQEKLLTKRVDRQGITMGSGDFKEPEPVKRLKVAADIGIKVALKTPFPQDADEKFEESDKDEESDDEEEAKSSDDQSDEDDDEDDDDEDQLELMREYAKIKKEREEEQKKREQSKLEEIKKKKMEEILTANPLLNQDLAEEALGTGSYSLKKRWYEETVFKNQSRNAPKEKKRFINDTVRSDFHRKFLNRFVQ